MNEQHMFEKGRINKKNRGKETVKQTKLRMEKKEIICDKKLEI